MEVSDTETFKEDCKKNGVKPIIIETQNYNNEKGIQAMTSSQHKGADFKNTLKTLTKAFCGYNILRAKVEKHPSSKKDDRHIYYESHLRLVLPRDYNLDIIDKLSKDNDFHCSKNLFKVDKDNIYQMITYRGYDMKLLSFQKKIWNMIDKLKKLEITFDKVEIEECIFDTNINVDNSWLNKK